MNFLLKKVKNLNSISKSFSLAYFCSKDNPSNLNNNIYIHKENYNLEQHKTYTKGVQQALEENEKEIKKKKCSKTKIIN